MGLDMHLSKRTYVQQWEHNGKDNYSVLVKRAGKAVPKTKIDPAKISYVEQEIGYWRKANAIHSWFINNCADGVDNCQAIDVSVDELKSLLAICEQILASCSLYGGKVVNGYTISVKGDNVPIYEDGQLMSNPEIAAELLPTTSGFFFGSTDYDQWYYKDIELTVRILKEALQDPDESFRYEASW